MPENKPAKFVAFGQALLALVAFLLYAGPGGFGGGAGLLAVFLGPLAPVVAYLAGSKVARTPGARTALTAGLSGGLAVFAVAFLLVLSSTEPLAPLLLIIAAIGLWVFYAVLVAGLWIAGRQEYS